MLVSPFGKYATIVAAVVSVGIIAAWLATALGFAPNNATLDGLALLVVGAALGTGAGAAVVTNGVGKVAEAANTRLDAVGAPPAAVATAAVEHGTVLPTVPPTNGSSTPLNDPTP